MFRANSEIAVATSVASVGDKPNSSAMHRPFRRAAIRSLSEATGTRASIPDSEHASTNSVTGVRGSVGAADRSIAHPGIRIDLLSAHPLGWFVRLTSIRHDAPTLALLSATRRKLHQSEAT